MSGWIKFDKDMASDPRLAHAASILVESYIVSRATPHGGSDLSHSDALRFMSNALRGAIVTLWCYADEHVRDDDTLPCNAKTLDSIVGIEGFCDAMPTEWVSESASGHVLLPGYCVKNSLNAKRKKAASGAERARRYRQNKKAGSNALRKRDGESDAQRDGERYLGVTLGVDQDLDQDQDEDKKETKNWSGAKRAHQLPQGFAPTGSHKELAAELHVNLDNELAQFRDHHTAKGSAMKDWDAAFRTWLRNAARFKPVAKSTRPPALAINRDFSKVDYWKGALPDDAF